MTVSLSLDSELTQVARVDRAVRALAEEMGFDARAVDDVELAIHEAVRDRGEGFELAARPGPLDEVWRLASSGRGILLMRALMDTVEHSTHPQGRRAHGSSNADHQREGKGESREDPYTQERRRDDSGSGREAHHRPWRCLLREARNGGAPQRT